MSLAKRLIIAAAALGLGAPMSAPLAAQGIAPDYAYDVAFFERVTLGGLEVTPFGIVRDRRCADERFCTREDTLIITVMLHDDRVPREVVLELNRRTAVPGGWLVLRDAGTIPTERGAQHLRNYRLGIEFIPLAEEDFF